MDVPLSEEPCTILHWMALLLEQLAYAMHFGNSNGIKVPNVLDWKGNL